MCTHMAYNTTISKFLLLHVCLLFVYHNSTRRTSVTRGIFLPSVIYPLHRTPVTRGIFLPSVIYPLHRTSVTRGIFLPSVIYPLHRTSVTRGILLPSAIYPLHRTSVTRGIFLPSVIYPLHRTSVTLLHRVSSYPVLYIPYMNLPAAILHPTPDYSHLLVHQLAWVLRDITEHTLMIFQLLDIGMFCGNVVFHVNIYLMTLLLQALVSLALHCSYQRMSGDRSFYQ